MHAHSGELQPEVRVGGGDVGKVEELRPPPHVLAPADDAAVLLVPTTVEHPGHRGRKSLIGDLLLRAIGVLRKVRKEYLGTLALNKTNQRPVGFRPRSARRRKLVCTYAMRVMSCYH